VLGRGTTVVAHPDGRLADYLDSLRRLEELVAVRSLTDLLPGHGPALADPLSVVRGYLRHRAERLEQVRAAVAAGARQLMFTVSLAADPVRTVELFGTRVLPRVRTAVG
jgi:glyoxylase-like metal-dependent hydrolase (beta-lactamase superfamily II)